MKIFIKYMASNRCKMVVRGELKKLGLHYIVIDYGEVEVLEQISEQDREQLKFALAQSGLELMDDRRAKLIGEIKKTILEMVYHGNWENEINLPEYLSQRFNHNYSYLENLFLEVQGTTLKHFINSHKIELVKELIFDNELSNLEIAQKLNYGSVVHLSNQFLESTGLSLSDFRQLKLKKTDPGRGDWEEINQT